VVWGLSGRVPGTYTILAGINDGAGVCGEIKKRAVKILECAAACCVKRSKIPTGRFELL
jgi:hypothetical protein